MRYPAVAGQFYERDAGALRKQIDGCYRHAIGPGRKPAVARDGARTLKALVVPHAGHVHSGPVAAHAYAALADDGLPATFVVPGPHHTGLAAAARSGAVTPSCSRPRTSPITSPRPRPPEGSAWRSTRSWHPT